MSNSPSPNGSNGHDERGRFTSGNAGGPGNPHAARVAKLRSVLLESVTDDDIQAAVVKLVALAREGDLAAIKELLDRTVGKSAAPTLLDVQGNCGATGIGVVPLGEAVRHLIANDPKYLEYLDRVTE